MIAFEVNDMTCGHCVGIITKAVKAVDAGADVHIDLATRRVAIDSTAADATSLRDAIEEAGYTPVIVAPVADGGVAPGAPTRSGCCCG